MCSRCARRTASISSSTYLAATSAGAVVTTVNPLWTEAEIGRQLRQCGVRWLVSTADLLAGKLRALVRETGIAEAFVIGAQSRWEATPFDALRLGSAPATAAPPIAAGSVSDAAFLLSSSGTTGLPKIVVLTHRNLVASLCQTRLVHKVTEDDVVIAALPLFHIFGLQISMNLALLEGATVVILPRFDLAAFLRAVEDLPGYQGRGRAADGARPRDQRPDRRLRPVEPARADLGAAPLGADLARACAQRIGCRVKQAYGMTEIGGGTHIAPDDGPDRPESIGPALPGVECRVVDSETGADAGPGEPGELLIRAPGMMRGYLGNPEATAATDRLRRLAAHRRHRHRGRGRVVLRRRPGEGADQVQGPVGRASRARGSPAHPPGGGGRGGRAAPGPGRRGGAQGLSSCSAHAVSAQELMDWVAERVAPYKRVRLVEFTDSIPKSPSGKILRRLLVARGAGADEAVAVRRP